MKITECGYATYKSLQGSSSCLACPANSNTTGVASPSITSCICNAGGYGLLDGSCAECSLGTYRSVDMIQALCETCPSHSNTSSTGSTVITQCSCDAGYTGSNGDICYECGLGTYKSINGSSSCLACPSHSNTTSVASTAVTQCLCDAGYTGANGDICLGCGYGTYKHLVGSSSCVSCPLNSNTTTTASPSIDSCICNSAGFGVSNGTCLECQLGTYRSLADSTASACVSCPDHSNTTSIASTSSASCLCNTGYTGNNGDICYACSFASYKPLTGSSSCLSCPSHANTSTVASTTNTSCVCEGGYVGNNGATCNECSAGYYCTGGTSSTICPVNTYCPKGSSLPTSCPNNSTSLVGSITLTNCTCITGYELIEKTCYVKLSSTGGSSSSSSTGSKNVNGSSSLFVTMKSSISLIITMTIIMMTMLLL
jgi:hypothetical protein